MKQYINNTQRKQQPKKFICEARTRRGNCGNGRGGNLRASEPAIASVIP